MGLIESSLFINIADRMAAQQVLLRDSLIDMSSGNLGYYVRIHDGVPEKMGDADIESDLVSAARDLDENYTSGSIIRSIFQGWTRALSSHVQNQGKTDIDAYLTDEDVNVAEDFHPVYNSVFGGAMDAINVFRKTVTNMGYGTYSESGVCVFTDGSALGTGTGTFNPDSNSAAAALEAFVGSGTTGHSGANDILMKVVGTDEAGTAIISDTITIPASTPVWTTFDVPGGQEFLDITSVQCAGGIADTVIGFQQKVERTPQL